MGLYVFTMGRYRRRKHHVAKKAIRKAAKTKRYQKDIDQLWTEAQQPDASKPRPVDPDLPGCGQYYCPACGYDTLCSKLSFSLGRALHPYCTFRRYFIGQGVLE